MDARFLLSLMLGLGLSACVGAETGWPDELEEAYDPGSDDGCVGGVEDDPILVPITLDSTDDIQVSCVIETPQGEETSPVGAYRVEVEFDGWARSCQVEMWDGSGYREGIDPETELPYDDGEVVRPGWEMWLGEDEEAGVATMAAVLDLDYRGQIWPPDDDRSLFTCEDTQSETFHIQICCEDEYDHTEVCRDVTEFLG